MATETTVAGRIQGEDKEFGALQRRDHQGAVQRAPLLAGEEHGGAGGFGGLAGLPLGGHGVGEAGEVGHRDRLVVAGGVGAAPGRVPAIVGARLEQVQLIVLVRPVLDGEHLAGARPDRHALQLRWP